MSRLVKEGPRTSEVEDPPLPSDDWAALAISVEALAPSLGTRLNETSMWGLYLRMTATALARGNVDVVVGRLAVAATRAPAERARETDALLLRAVRLARSPG